MNQKDRKEMKNIVSTALIDYHEGALMPVFNDALERIDKNLERIDKNQEAIKENQRTIQGLMRKLDSSIKEQKELNKEFIRRTDDHEERIDLLERPAYAGML